MNREIKFRAWDKIVNKMFAPSMINKDGDVRHTYEGGETWLLKATGSFVLMQYTGLKDKKGKEIYEGDLCKKYYKGEWVTLQIAWNPLGMWSVKWKDGYLNNYHIHSGNLEVIGNVYEKLE